MLIHNNKLDKIDFKKCKDYKNILIYNKGTRRFFSYMNLEKFTKFKDGTYGWHIFDELGELEKVLRYTTLEYYIEDENLEVYEMGLVTNSLEMIKS